MTAPPARVIWAAMDFCQQLSAYYPDKGLGAARLYGEMVEQAVLADRLGYESVSLTEHHLINILLIPAPLPLAVKIADATARVKIMTSVVVLPLHDMRILAGELVVTDALTDGRLLLGVGRGAFAWEMDRLGMPLENSREVFAESLEVLQALLTREEVAWDGTHYRFDALTIMPRPDRPGGPPLMLACVTPPSILDAARRGFHVQTTPLSGHGRQVADQVAAFHQGKAETPTGQTLSLSRVAFLTRSPADTRDKLERAQAYFSRFDNVFTGPGIVEAGMIAPLPRAQSVEELAENVLICESSEMIDRLAPYADLGIDRFILNMNFGASQTETLESIQAFAEEVMGSCN